MKKLTPSLFLVYLILTIIGVVSAFPFYFVLVSGTNSSVEVIRGKMFFGTSIADNFTKLLAAVPFGMGFINSIRNALVQVLASLLVCSMAGYGFTVYRSRAKDRLMSILLLSMMIPFAAVMIPLFRLAVSLKLLNTTAGIVMPSLATAFLIFFFRQVTQSFPMELVQAARVDGVGEFGIFARIYMPVMSPTYAAAAIVTFMAGWNNFMWPLIILQKESSRTLPILITRLSEGYVTDYGVQLLAITLSIIPTLLIFITQQRRFVEGILGAVKS